MPKIICPNCGKYFYLDPNTYRNYSGDVKCIICGALLEVSLTHGTLRSTPILKKRIDLYDIPDAPKNINADIAEAQICHEVGAYKACVVMCRRALEQVCDDRGAKGKSLHDKIHDLLNKGIISAEMFEIFDEIRYFGNYGAHPKNDLLGDVTEEDAALVLEATIHITKHIYEMPEKLKKLKERRRGN